MSTRLLVFWMLLFSSRASTISTNNTFIVIWALVAVVWMLHKNFGYIKDFIKYILLLSTISILYYFLNGTLDIATYSGVFTIMLGVYSTVKICGSKFLVIFVEVVSFLALISIPLYLIQLVAFDKLYAVNNLFSLDNRGNSNSLIFNLIKLHAIRNCGFMWEPGAFAAVLTITLFLNLTIFENYKIKTRRNVILFLALISTISTMGILSLVFPLMVITLRKKAYFAFVFVAILSPFILSLDFVVPKLIKETQSIELDLDKAQHANDATRVSVSRVTSFVIDYPNFIQRPLLGYGMDYKTTNQKIINATYNENVTRSSGLMNLLLRLGLVGLLAYLYIFYRSVKSLTNKSTGWLFAALVLFVLFSNPLEYSTFIFSLFFIGHGIHRRSRLQSPKAHFIVPESPAYSELSRV